MRVLMTTRGSSGHLLALVPFAHACRRAGHDVVVAAQHQNRGNVERAALPFAGVGEPPTEAWAPLLEQFGRLDVDAASAVMIRDYFARLDTAAALPDLRALVEDWPPDVIVRDGWEFASILIAELHRIPLARVGLGLAATDDQTTTLVAGVIDNVRARLGLPPDPVGDRLRDTPYLSWMPEALEDRAFPGPPRTHRFRHGDGASAPADRRGAPLVVLSFGSVAAARHLPYFPALYRGAIDALAPLPLRLLVTVGEDGDPAALGPLPANVTVERWVPQDATLPHADAVVCHGGHGSTLGALSYGVPLVVLPLFSADQWDNAAAVARAGAGIALDAERATRPVLALPGAGTLTALGPAVERVLGEPAFRAAARRIAAEMHALRPAGAVVELLTELAGTRVG